MKQNYTDDECLKQTAWIRTLIFLIEYMGVACSGILAIWLISID